MYNQNNGYGGFNEEAADNYNYVPRRPISITIVCVVIALILVIGLVGLMDLTANASQSNPAWYWIFIIGQFALIVASMVGLWNMRKWGAYAYTVNFVISLGLQLFAFTPFIFISMILMFFIYRKFSEMR